MIHQLISTEGPGLAYWESITARLNAWEAEHLKRLNDAVRRDFATKKKRKSYSGKSKCVCGQRARKGGQCWTCANAGRVVKCADGCGATWLYVDHPFMKYTPECREKKKRTDERAARKVRMQERRKAA